MIFLQFLVVSFAVFMMYVAQIHRRKNHLEGSEYLFWLFIWTSFSLAALWPEAFRGLAQTLSISRLFDLLVIIAFMVLSYVTFSNRILTKRLQQKIEVVVRQRALGEPMQELKKKDVLVPAKQKRSKKTA